MGVNVLVANVWNPLIKNIALRLRPYFASDKIQLLRKIDPDADIMDVAAQGYSFPSGHSSSAVAVYGSLAAHEKKNRLLRVWPSCCRCWWASPGWWWAPIIPRTCSAAGCWA